MVRKVAISLAVILTGWPSSNLSAAAAQPFPTANVWWRDGVCYEVFVRSFYDSDGDGIGDLRGLAARLDYINDGNPTAGKA